MSKENVVRSCKFKAGRRNLVLVEYLHKDALMLSKTVLFFFSVVGFDMNWH